MKTVAFHFLYLFAECIVLPTIHLSAWLYECSNDLYSRIWHKIEPPPF